MRTLRLRTSSCLTAFPKLPLFTTSSPRSLAVLNLHLDIGDLRKSIQAYAKRNENTLRALRYIIEQEGPHDLTNTIVKVLTKLQNAPSSYERSVKSTQKAVLHAINQYFQEFELVPIEKLMHCSYHVPKLREW